MNKKLRELRIKNGLTQAQCAELAMAGSYRTWQDWEYGARNMPPAKFKVFMDNLKLLKR